MKNARTLRTTVGAVIAVVAITALAGCTSSGDGDADSTPEPTASEYTPSVTDEGSELIAGIADCAQVAGGFGTLTEGLELTLESLDETGVFCDWAAADDENHVVSVEVLGTEADAVPTADAVAASGGTVVENAKVDEAGGIVYSIAGADNAAYSLTAVLPSYSVSVTAVGGELGEEQIAQITAGLEAIIG